MSDTNDYSLDEDERNPGWMSRLGSGYVTNPPPRYRPEPPVDWPLGPPPVRCVDCARSKEMRFGFCSVANKRAAGLAHWRRCGSFEPRPAAGKDRPAEKGEKRPTSAPPRPELPTLPLHPAMRLRAALVDQGAIHLLAELTALDGGRVGVRLAPDLTDGEVLDTLRWIAWILRSDP
ncbi:hypothetical protein [Thiocapsa sp. UBA6158]|jgi:hypothetical protein|uniref:hypothetical protein n=1 Tax=Thiocapsa sp. UBA6158 TaxID=1947692 RepID=UPI0025D40014|nr:hypothetical protein [Thiocapsa sp. UBA6158]